MELVQDKLRAYAKEYPGFTYRKSKGGYSYGFKRGQRWNINQRAMVWITREMNTHPHVSNSPISFWWAYAENKQRTATPFADMLLNAKPSAVILRATV